MNVKISMILIFSLFGISNVILSYMYTHFIRFVA